MDVANLLADNDAQREDGAEARRQSHQYATRHSLTSQTLQEPAGGRNTMMGSPTKTYVGMTAAGAAGPRPSPNGKQQKHVMFELLLPELPQARARLPMRVMISPHDTTDSILTTVKNFYGLYDGSGVSFQDRGGNVIIARYENFENDMTVYVRVTAPDPDVASVRSRDSLSPKKPTLGAPFEMRPPSRNPSRPTSRAANRRSISPQSNRGQTRGRSQRSRETSAYGDNHDGYSSGSDGGNGSVTSSRRDALHASAEISVNNILEGGRRKRAKFESSELPLFVPPQIPVAASASSVSPQRRATNGSAASPLPYSNQYTFSYTQPLPSPQSYGRPESQVMPSPAYGAGIYNSAQQMRGLGQVSYGAPRQSTGGILPTPEPTVGSVISDEDVALQLMRLGDMSNFSSHGRTSTSTLDDALSGKAEAASSDEESDEDGELALPTAPSKQPHSAGPQRKKQRMLDENLPSDTTQDSEDYEEQSSFKGESDEIVPEYENMDSVPSRKGSKSKAPRPRGSIASTNGSIKTNKSRPVAPLKSKKSTSGTNTKTPMSPASLPSQSRKTSLASTINFAPQLNADEEDLSSKPRCQRCRKSKKGCDRQRPCGRCRDAGIGIEGCVSEDEGGNRKGRYGRHMGVAVKKDEIDSPMMAIAASKEAGFAMPGAPADKGKKRKR